LNFEDDLNTLGDRRDDKRRFLALLRHALYLWEGGGYFESVRQVISMRKNGTKEVLALINARAKDNEDVAQLGYLFSSYLSQ
jgi:hypothetical protein